MNRVAGQEGVAGFMPLGEALAHAEHCRNQGRLVEAEAICRQILSAQPNLPEAAHLLGVIVHQSGKLGERWMLNREDNPWYPNMRLFRQREGEDWSHVIARVAAELEAVAQGDLARLMPFKAAGDRRAAQAAAIMAADAAHTATPAAQSPAVAVGHVLTLAEQKRRQGLLGDADDLARQAAAAQPDNAEAAHLLGIVAHQSGKLGEAIEHLRRAAAIKPEVALYHANLGEMCRLAGRIDEAVAAGRRALEINSNYPEALSNLGIALFEQAKFEEALALYDRALALEPNFVQAHSNRGNALQRLKRFAEAEPSYRRALALQPSFADAWNNLGTCLRELKRPEEAETIYRKALELGPNNPETLDNLALAVKDLDRLEEAAELMRRALVIEQRSDELHLHYGTILLDQNKTDAAAVAAARALALNPTNPDVVNLMGRVAAERGDLAGALERYRQALALKPDLADAHNNRGNALKDLGRLQEARDAYRTALRIDPRRPGLYLNLADAKTFRPGDDDLAAMEQLAADTEGLSRSERMQLDFALGKVYADLRQHDRSFKHLLAGNAAKRATIDYDEQSTFAQFDRIEALFTPALIKAKSGGGDLSRLPIFVIGMPRSGTTLVEQIIASHPAVHGGGELQTLSDVLLTVRGTDGAAIAYPEFVAALDMGALAQLGTRYVALASALAAAASPSLPSPARERSRASSDALCGGGKGGGDGGLRITDKMPSNYYFVGLIHLALPHAKIVYTIRNPVDTCVSCFSKLFSAEQSHTYDLAELGRYYKRYARLMAHWRRVLGTYPGCPLRGCGRGFGG